MGHDNSLQRELIEEENAKMLFFLERHQRWAKLSDETVIVHKHREIAEMLRDLVNENETLIEWLKA
jgi:hypothetical protein